MQSALTQRQKELIEAHSPAHKQAGLAGILDALVDAQVEDPGNVALNVLRLAADVASQETVTIGADVYEANIVNTDTTEDVSGGELATGTPTVSTITIASHGLSAGDLIRVENEIMKVIGVPSANQVVVQRGHSGTTVATHADATDILKAGTAAAAGRLEVGLVTTLTPAAFSVALVAVIGTDGKEPVSALKVSDNEVLIWTKAVSDLPEACAETLAGTNNVWAAATMFGRRAAGQRRFAVQKRVPTATEVALGNMHFVFDFAPVVQAARVAPTATPGAQKAWDGAATAGGNRVTLDNGGSTDWAATDTVELIVSD